MLSGVQAEPITKDTREFLQLMRQWERSNIPLGKDSQEDDPKMRSNVDRDLMGRCFRMRGKRGCDAEMAVACLRGSGRREGLCRRLIRNFRGMP